MSLGAVTLSLIAIRVADLDRSIEFYTSGCDFEMEREFTTPSFTAAIVRAGSAGIELIRPTDATASEPADHGDMLRKSSSTPTTRRRSCARPAGSAAE